MIKHKSCDNCGTTHTFGKGEGCEALVPYCDVHPDAELKEVHNDEGFSLGHECPLCALRCVYHPDTGFKDLGRRSYRGDILKECPKCVEGKKILGSGLSVSEQSDMYCDWLRGL